MTEPTEPGAEGPGEHAGAGWLASAFGAATGAPAAGVRLKIEPDRVFAAAKIVSAQADTLSAALAQHGPTLQIEAPSRNEVSRNAADAWNAAVADGEESQFASAETYLQGLYRLTEQLRDAADRYRLADEESAAAFEDRGVEP